MKKGVIFKSLRVVIVLLLAVGLAWQLWIMRPEAERQVPAKVGPLVEAFAASGEDLNMIIEAYGTVRARETLKLVAEVKGQITDIDPSFKEGLWVRKGTQLIRIDPRSYQLEVDKRNAQIKQTQAELNRLKQEVKNTHASLSIIKSDVALAKAEVSRVEKLSGSQVVSQTSLDQARQRYLARLERLQGLENQLALTGPVQEQLIAQLNTAKVLLNQAKLDLEKTKVQIPFDGWILEKCVEKGQLVHPGELLGSAYKDGGLDIEVRIPVKDLKWLLPELTNGSMPDAEIVFSQSDAFSLWRAKVARVKAQMDERTRTLPVILEVDTTLEADMKTSSFPLRPGMFVLVRIKGKKIMQVFKVPRHVVHDDNIVYLVKDNRLQFRPVRIVRRFKDSVIINKGLSDGDLIVKTPLPTASDGMSVRLQDNGNRS